jgi:hypothetical protein
LLNTLSAVRWKVNSSQNLTASI